MNDASILVVDDQPQIRRTLRTILSTEGYSVLEAANGEGAVSAFTNGGPDVVLLDLNMPGIGGLATCRRLREKTRASIIVLTVRNAEHDKVAALDAGADDYITKPFSTPELLARVRAALRRGTGKPPARLELDDFTIDFAERCVLAHRRESRLTPKEYDLLSFLVAKANQTVSHENLLRSVWGPEYGNEVEYLRVFINHIRKKIEPDPAQPKYLITEPWAGYRFRLPP